MFRYSGAYLQIHLETFGKTGCRRIVPGEFLAVDPKGRAVLIGAVEKQKLVYVLNRDTKAKLTMSSPLEANKSHTVTFATTGIDVGFENPIFACLEYDYDDKDKPEMMLVYYELDLGLNNVVRRWSDAVDRTANLVISGNFRLTCQCRVEVMVQEVFWFVRQITSPTKIKDM